MNVAQLSSGYASDIAAIEGFAALLGDGFENPENIRAKVLFTIPEHPQHSFVLRYDDDRLIVSGDTEGKVDTQVTIPIATMHRIINEFETLDWRDPHIIGTITFTGHLAHANHLAKSCLRPSRGTMARFRKSERLSAAKGHRHLTKLDTLHQPTQRQILEAMEEGRPVVITGLEPTQPRADWTVDRLASCYGDAVISVGSATQRQTLTNVIEDIKDFGLNPYGDMINGFAKPYTEGAALPEVMRPDFRPLFFDSEDFIVPQLWLGSVPTHMPMSSLHRYPLTSFQLQIIGRKRFDLYSPDQVDLIYPMKAYNNCQPCWFKPEVPDFNVYPKAREAKSISVTLHPGDLLVQPAGWFHQLRALDSPDMSVSYSWRY
ncbi:cupin-like domain-containing protein [uncultured Tateyamaria sp.]|uniref:cupin-like domain-containing protein n=1 Tax=uncultured Tateyamaria sp. TaxID=455651 RepID=UPI00260E23B4|nr:cupin-like domain-containing protein [uncultured Tateyamaria sp.]